LSPFLRGKNTAKTTFVFILSLWALPKAANISPFQFWALPKAEICRPFRALILMNHLFSTMKKST
jgi:hypothetical protein